MPYGFTQTQKNRKMKQFWSVNLTEIGRFYSDYFIDKD